MKQTRIVIVDDSEICRTLLRQVLEVDPALEVVGEATNGEQARTLIARLLPDLVTMDLAMPGEGGLSAIERLMATHPVPILVVTSATTPQSAFEAIQRGALEVVAKPTAEDEPACARVRDTVRELARVPVVRHLSAHSRGCAPRKLASSSLRSLEVRSRPRLVAIGASAGGPSAIVAVLRQLPKQVAVAIVQHLPPGFADGFARFIATATQRPTIVVDREVAISPETIYIAPDRAHLVGLRDGVLGAQAGTTIDGHLPSVTLLFSSVAHAFGANAVGVLLTGIGSDGADGMIALREAGALTIAQDEASSAVYGMPRVARERGGAEHVLPLDQIGSAVRAAIEGAP